MKAIVAITAVVALALPAAARVEAAGERSAVLRLSTAHPVSLRGSRFLAGERVTVKAHSGGGTRTRIVVAGAAGTFLVRFAGLPFDRCQGFLAVARGTRSSLASFKLPQPMCPPA